MKEFQLTYEFDPVYPYSVETRHPKSLVEGGAKVRVPLLCCVTGRADIEFGMDGDWSVSAIGIDYRSPVSGEYVPHWLEENDALFEAIKGALCRDEATSIQAMVDERVSDERDLRTTRYAAE